MKNTSNHLLWGAKRLRILFFFIFCSLSLHNYAISIGTYAKEKTLTVEMQNKTVKEVLDYIERNSEFIFFYYNKVLDTKRNVNLSVKDKPITVILDQLFKGTDVLYEIKDRQISLKRAVKQPLPSENQQKRKLAGTVTDAVTNEPLVGVSIQVKESMTVGTITDLDGRFTIEVSNSMNLIISYIGYKKQTISVGKSTTLNVKMVPDNKVLDEVVVVGYGSQKKANLTGAVSTVDVNKTLGSRPVTDLARGLQGASPGLMVTTSSGDIGQNAEVHIRGIQGSLNAEAKPLILLDNVEIDNLMMVNPNDIESISVLKDAASSSIYGARGTWGVILITTKKGSKGKPVVSYDNSFAWSSPMNTPEIADGALGVEYMLACHRRTAPNKSDFNILGAYYDDLSIERMRQWKQLYGGKDLGDKMVLGRDYEIRNGHPYFYRTWDVDEVFLNNASFQQKHNLSISGGGDKFSYFGSFAMLDQDGLVKITPEPDNFSRFNGTLRIEGKPSKFFTIRGTLMYSHSNKTSPNFRLANAASGANEYWFNIYRYPETYPYGTIDGVPLKNIRTELEQAHMNEKITDMNRFQIGTTLTILKGWTADFDYTYVTNNIHDKKATSPISGINHWSDPSMTKFENNFFPAEDYVILNSTWSKRQVAKGYSTFSKKLGKHQFKAMVGLDAEYYRSEYQYSKRYGLYEPSKPELILTDSSVQETTGYPSHWSTLGFFGRINYNFMDRYLFEFNVRRDGASKFSKNCRWGTFPSVSVGWLLSEEAFMVHLKEISRLSFAKLRVSWGRIGNNNIGSFDYMSKITASKSNWYMGTANPMAFSTPTVAATTLTWEPVETIDFGFNAKFFDNALDVEFDWFKRTTRDMATFGEEVPLSLGASAPARNFGEMSTMGWELSVGFNKVINKDWTINMQASLSDQTSKITKHANKEVSIKEGGNSCPNYEGKILGEIWGYETDRLFRENDFDGNNGDANPTWYYGSNTPNQDALNTQNAFHYGPGDVKYKDLNGDGVVDYGAGTNLNHGDMKVIGNTTPRYIFGLRAGFTWKNIDFSAFLQGVGKRDYWGTGSLVIPAFTMNEAVYQNQVTNYWTPEKQDAYYPAPSNPGSNNHNGNWQCQTRYLLNMAYARLKNLTVGYTFSKSWVDKMHLTSVRLFVSGENLFTIDNLDVTIDPEIQQNSVAGFTDAKSFGRTYPYFRTWSFGVQVKL